MLPKLLQPALDGVLKRVHRSRLYYERYNNTLPLGINRAYEQYARECSADYTRRNGARTFAPSPLFSNAATSIQGAFPADKARAYSATISQLIERHDPAVIHPKDYDDLQMSVREPLKTLGTGCMDVFRSLSVHEALLRFFRGDYRVEWVNVFRSIPAQRAVSSWLWHSDSFPPHTCKIFLHLTPVDADTGATEFMNLEDTMAYRRAGYFGQHLEERFKDLEEFGKEHGIPYRPFHFDAQPGDVTLFDTNFFHCAVSPRKAFRDVVQFMLVPNPIPWDEQFARDGIELLKQVTGGYRHDPRRPAAV